MTPSRRTCSPRWRRRNTTTSARRRRSWKTCPNTRRCSAIATLAFQNRPLAVAQLPEFLLLFETLEVDMSRLSDLIESTARQSQSQGRAAVQFSKRLMVGIALTAFLLLGAISYRILVRNFSRRIAQITQVANTLAEGNLDQQIEIRSNDEVGQMADALRRMVEKFSQVIGQVRSGASALSAAAAQVRR